MYQVEGLGVVCVVSFLLQWCSCNFVERCLGFKINIYQVVCDLEFSFM